MNRVLFALTLSCVLLLAGCASGPAEEAVPAVPAEPSAPAAIDLFDGATLDGWEVFVEDPEVKKEDVWSVQDGLLVTTGEPLGYLHTAESFQDFELVVEWRWAPGTEAGNNGTLMRINGEPSPVPRCIEAQMQSGNEGDVYSFHGMVIEGPPERTKTSENDLVGEFVGVKRMEDAANPPGEWNRYDIRAEGGDITVKLNDKLVNKVTNAPLISGPVGVQSEGGIAQFRTIRITPLNAE
jgi:3-keto-disaccharide hydrolase